MIASQFASLDGDRGVRRRPGRLAVRSPPGSDAYRPAPSARGATARIAQKVLGMRNTTILYLAGIKTICTYLRNLTPALTHCTAVRRDKGCTPISPSVGSDEQCRTSSRAGRRGRMARAGVRGTYTL